MVDAISISDLFYKIIDKIEAGEPPPEIIIAGQTYLLKKPPDGDTMQRIIADIFSQLQEDKDAALMKLLTATIKGERVILIQQNDYEVGTLKYQFRFVEGQLPFKPASIPDVENPQRSE